MYIYICWKLLSNRNFNGPYLEAEVVEEVMGWLGWVGQQLPTKKLHTCTRIDAHIYKASQPRGRASDSRAYGRQEMQGVIFKCTRHECSVFVNLRPLLLRIHSRHQFSLPEKTGSHCEIRTHVHPFTRRRIDAHTLWNESTCNVINSDSQHVWNTCTSAQTMLRPQYLQLKWSIYVLYMYMYSTRQKKLPINGLFNGPPVPVPFPFNVRSTSVQCPFVARLIPVHF